LLVIYEHASVYEHLFLRESSNAIFCVKLLFSYTCSKCVDFDLCDFCLRKHAHPHKMRPRGVDIQSEIPEVNREVKRDELLHEEGDTTAVRCFAHAAQCRDVDCSQLHCHKLKTLFYHSKVLGLL